MQKTTWFILACALLGTSCAQQQKSIVVSNPTDIAREELVSIPYAEFTRHFQVDSIFSVKLAESEIELPYQLEKRGNTVPENVLIWVPVDAKGEITLSVTKQDTKPAFKTQTYARFVPERFDDFAWENNVLAFRMYGKALEGRPDDAQGADVWAKRTEELVIDKWYKENDYHTDHGEGLDYYAVGQTLGAGDIAPYFDNKIHFTKHYREYQILDNGPLRTTFKLSFEPEELNGQTISLTKTISLDAGQHFNKVIIDLENQQSESTPVVIGLARRGESESQYDYNESNRSLAYWEPDIQGHGQTGTALILPEDPLTFIDNDSTQFLLSTDIQQNKPFVYYNGAAWNKGGQVTSADEWKGFVQKQVEKINTPLVVKLK
ncbi:DUF4861 domain-containing protein [Sphingobacterium phlebotomi]|uniref:DUF4861 domain-containing protein n=1 Tax=Sphingobacterium phlebotomi TaxID=2605433 RepID=A0A5D4H905_9SPHI|nr:DUF4861 family protein [Sphingobacterium phlebotomi]TYR37336.1 DUF4861 domain-containing protein [Sphingobacterium phlebotomi]